MRITLHYHWVFDKLNGDAEIVDYDYEVVATDEDIVDYLIPSVLREEEKSIYTRAIRHTMDYLHEYIDYDDFSADEFFIEYLKEKYEWEAKIEWGNR